MHRALALVAAVSATLLAPLADAQSVPDLADVHTPLLPSVVRVGEARHLVWEVFVRNRFPHPIRLTGVEVDDAGTAQRLVTLGSAELEAQTRVWPSSQPQGLDLATDATAVVYLWVTLADDAAPPTRIQQRVSLEVGGDTQVRYVPVDVSPEPPVVVRPPLMGEGWLAVNAPGNTAVHRRSVQVMDAGLFMAQRYAIDLVRVVGESSFQGDPLNNASYHAYGAEALAVGDGVVVAVQDDIPENVPGPDSRAVPITYDTLAGNYAVLDLGGGRYAVYAHLQPGSLRVAVGDAVSVGQTLGLVGNSGNASEPHLHFHVCDQPDALRCQGRPYAFDEFLQVAVTRDEAGHTTAGPPVLLRESLPVEYGYLIFAPRGALGPPPPSP